MMDRRAQPIPEGEAGRYGSNRQGKRGCDIKRSWRVTQEQQTKDL